MITIDQYYDHQQINRYNDHLTEFAAWYPINCSQ